MWIKKVLMLVLADILIVLISYFMALLLRFDFVFSSIPEEYLMGYLWSMPFWIISTIVIFYICRLYHSIWRLASVAELQMILIAYSILAVVYSMGMLFMQMHMPRSYYFIGFLLNFLMTTGLRFSYRLMRFWVNSRNTNADAGGEMHAKDHVMVIGAGAAGQALIKEIINSKKLNTQVVCIIDDNPTKHGRVLEGITIVGDRYSIPEMAKKYNVNLEVRSSLERVEGTVVKEAIKMEKMLIRGVAKDNNVTRVSIVGVPDTPGIAYKIFSLLSAKKINVDIILQSVGRDGTKDIVFTVAGDQMEETKEALEASDILHDAKVTLDNDVTKLSIVGAGMETHPGVATKMFEALFEHDINIQMIATSEIKISVLIDKKDADRAVKAVHDAFFA